MHEVARVDVKRNVVILLVYTVIYLLWLYGTDLLLNSDFLNQLNRYVRIMLVTSPGHLAIIYLIYRYFGMLKVNERIQHQNEVKIKDLSEHHGKQALYMLLTDYMIDKECRSIEVVTEIFSRLITMVDSCDLGSVLLLESEKVTFIDTVGYDIDLLNTLNMDPNKIEFNTFGLHTNISAEYGMSEKISAENYERYKEKTPCIYESIYIGVEDNDGVKLSVALDITEDRYQTLGHGYTENEVTLLKEVQVLITAVFRMKSSMLARDMLQKDIVTAFISALEQHDIYTKGHSESVAQISVDIGKRLGFSEEGLRELEWAAMIHDIGKIVIPSEILNKQGRLTKDEYAIIKGHPVNGEKFLEKSHSLKKISKYIRHHHERFDGHGYPDGLKGSKIPLCARIIGVADAYHAMTSNRPYKEAMSIEDAIKEVKDNEGSQFCPIVVNAFLKTL